VGQGFLFVVKVRYDNFSMDLHCLAYRFGRLLIRAYRFCFIKTDIVYLSPLPKGPKILALNHPSTSDPFLLLTLTREPITILITDVLFKIPLFGWFLKYVHQIPVDPQHGCLAYTQAKKVLEAGGTLGVFVEGGITERGLKASKPKSGAVRLALETGVPIIPIGLHLKSEKIHHLKSNIKTEQVVGRWYFRGPVTITIGKPIYPSGPIENWAAVTRHTHHLWDSIVTLASVSSNRYELACVKNVNPPIIPRYARSVWSLVLSFWFYLGR
jgi:1-acyl-sn-glycerol-3-phosphate acyltransferase